MRRNVIAMMVGLLVVVVSGLAGCGGGGSSSSPAPVGSDVVSKGTISAFGSVFVNGVKFNVLNSTIIIDDTSVPESSLALGMTVKVHGIIDSTNLTGTADNIEYEDSLAGPVANLSMATKSFTILGQMVAVTGSTVYGGVKNLQGLTNGTIVEVSGILNIDDSITATRVEVKTAPAPEYKIRGIVSAFNGTAKTFKLTVTSTLVYTVNFSAATILPFNSALADGAYVKVKATKAPIGTTLNATKVSVKRIDLEDASRAEIEGFVAGYNSAAKTFTINGTKVNASAITLPAGFANGLRVEIEGPIVKGVLNATEVEVKGDNDVSLEGVVKAKGAATLTVLTVTGATVIADVIKSTIYMDSSTKKDPKFSLASINFNDTVEVIGYYNGSGAFIAGYIERYAVSPSVTGGGPGSIGTGF